ncbi:MAG: hypothetical protein QOJ29_59 [Thermoleophilaceae bacterium]|jgi:hypothetical protein|nr:hypothetical protein [Thermoleophilaceae bacterium]
MSIVAATQGSFPLTGVAGLPNVTVAFRGEHWSNRYASGAVTPGEAVVPTTSAGRLYVRKATSADAVTQMGIALRCVDIPDSNFGVGSLGPNEIKNTVIAHGEYVDVNYSGAFHLTLIEPAAYAPADLIGWKAAATRPTGKSGTGAWAKAGSGVVASLFEVMEFRPYSADGHEGILTVRSLRGQF